MSKPSHTRVSIIVIIIPAPSRQYMAVCSSPLFRFQFHRVAWHLSNTSTASDQSRLADLLRISPVKVRCSTGDKTWKHSGTSTSRSAVFKCDFQNWSREKCYQSQETQEESLKYATESQWQKIFT
ncbi:hypothetical protein RRG08_001821 [Elysia crispata]|uniref:Uncharacterized protein n=1 Tax=Elysia crispata TaxID=231223 RepID=A0AAE0Y778_9GAST|nr:hypothetical protein RRG08_001821 [Elysia crispata]